jgi:hypothetical protein
MVDHTEKNCAYFLGGNAYPQATDAESIYHYHEAKLSFDTLILLLGTVQRYEAELGTLKSQVMQKRQGAARQATTTRRPGEERTRCATNVSAHFFAL